MTDELIARADAAILLDAPTASPREWTVPSEPTEEMIEAGTDMFCDQTQWAFDADAKCAVYNIYRAMLKAGESGDAEHDLRPPPHGELA